MNEEITNIIIKKYDSKLLNNQKILCKHISRFKTFNKKFVAAKFRKKFKINIIDNKIPTIDLDLFNIYLEKINDDDNDSKNYKEDLIIFITLSNIILRIIKKFDNPNLYILCNEVDYLIVRKIQKLFPTTKWILFGEGKNIFTPNIMKYSGSFN